MVFMKIALVENDEMSTDVIVTLLNMWGHESSAFKNIESGINAYNNDQFDVLWIDYKFILGSFPRETDIIEKKRDIPLIITSTITREKFGEEQNFGLDYFFLQKPYQWRKILKILKEIQKYIDLNL
jgi:DNA-binding NtrC family response regulator